MLAATPSHIHALFLLCSKSAATARGFEPLRADSDTLSCFGENALAGNLLFPSLGGGGTKWPGLLLLDLTGSTPGGRICLAAIREVLLKKEFAPIWKHLALVGWEEWGKRQTGNGKGKHEVAGPV